MHNTAGTEAKQYAAVTINLQLVDLSERLAKVVELLDERLSCVSRTGCEEPEKAKPDVSMPSLFAEYTIQLFRINDEINKLHDILQRLELP